MKQFIIDNLQLIIDNVKLELKTNCQRNSQLSIINYQFIIITLAMIMTSCQREPLYDETGNLMMEIAIDYDIKHMPDVPEPEMMFVGFYEPETGKLLSTEYTGPRGGEIYVEPGKYDILVYNFDTEATQIRNNQDIGTAEAYTNIVQGNVGRAFRSLMAQLIERAPSKTRAKEFQSQPVINEPDLLFTGLDEEVVVPVRGNSPDLFTIHADAATIVETYAIEMTNITGMEFIESAEVYITGQVQSKLIASHEITGAPSIIYFPIYTSTNARSNVLGTTFHTFGKYPGADNSVILVVKLTDIDGNITVIEEDVTDVFNNPDDNDYDIVIDKPIEIEPPTGGGLTPSVTLWNEVITNITI